MAARTDPRQNIVNLKWGGVTSGWIAIGSFFGDVIGGPSALVYSKDRSLLNEVTLGDQTRDDGRHDQEDTRPYIRHFNDLIDSCACDPKGNCLFGIERNDPKGDGSGTPARLKFVGPNVGGEVKEGFTSLSTVADKDGNFYVYLRESPLTGALGSASVEKLSPAGVTLHTYASGITPVIGGGVVCAPDGRFVYTDSTNIFGYDKDGNSIWTVPVPKASSDFGCFLSFGTGVIAADDDNPSRTVFGFGTFPVGSDVNVSFGVINIDNGQVVWRVDRSSAFGDSPLDCDTDKKGNLWVSYQSVSGGGDLPVHLQKFDQAGNMLLNFETTPAGGGLGFGCVVINGGTHVASGKGITTTWVPDPENNPDTTAIYEHDYLEIYDAETGANVTETLWGQWGETPGRTRDDGISWDSFLIGFGRGPFS